MFDDYAHTRDDVDAYDPEYLENTDEEYPRDND